MATKKCSNGHHYDASIYGDKCPFCPEGRTRVSSETPTVGTPIDGITGETKPMNDEFGVNNLGGGRTIIKRNGTKVGGKEACLVGVLITYIQNPVGDVFRVNEGKTLIGTDVTNDIVISDEAVSSKHLQILYREGDKKFWAKDEMSTNGTYINGQFMDCDQAVELKSGDVIVLGGTKLIFLAVPADF